MPDQDTGNADQKQRNFLATKDARGRFGIGGLSKKRCGGAEDRKRQNARQNDVTHQTSPDSARPLQPG